MLSTHATIMSVKFGKILRKLRTAEGVGIKKLAPDLGVSYTYLSKLENDEVLPSIELVERVARHFDYDRDQLILSAGKIPAEVFKILREHPDEALEFLRKRFGRKHVGGSKS